MASTDIVVRASDTAGAVGTSFLVEWTGPDDAFVEAVMVGTESESGIAFVSEGRRLR